MASNRIGRINEEIQRELSGLLRTVKDPRVADAMLTITHVDTTSDLRYSRIYISALDRTDEKDLMRGLKSASGYLRHELGQKLQLRYTPELIFTPDDSIDQGNRIIGMLGEIRDAEPVGPSSDPQAKIEEEGSEEPCPNTHWSSGCGRTITF